MKELKVIITSLLSNNQNHYYSLLDYD